jgi:type II secretory pathway component PulL
MPTTLTLPSEHLSVLSVRLPPTPPHRLQAALAGALEEELLDEPADLHFALAHNAYEDIKTGRVFEVMVCNKAWLRSLVDQRAQKGGATLHIVPNDPVLQAAHWDLAQFDFAPRAAWRGMLIGILSDLLRSPEWRAARIAILLIVIAHLVGINVWAWRDRMALADKRAQINRILLQTYPSTAIVVDASAQMLRATQTMRIRGGALGEQDLERQLAKLGQPAAQIDYVAGTLKVAP